MIIKQYVNFYFIACTPFKFVADMNDKSKSNLKRDHTPFSYNGKTNNQHTNTAGSTKFRKYMPEF